jgi:5-hydroxyisourate hydrolase-like protein (transthyretin family)
MMPSMSKWIPCLALVGLCGCVSDRGARKAEQAEARPAPEPIRPRGASHEKVTEKDTNDDGKPDVWVYSVEERGADGRSRQRMVRKELDINWDGKVDIVRFYDAREQVERELLDLDFDGRVDQVNFYEKGLIVRKERDLDYDGRTDLWIFFERGKIVRREQDTNSDGRVDYWEYWENDQVERIGEDLDGDGQVDRWTRNPEAAGVAR